MTGARDADAVWIVEQSFEVCLGSQGAGGQAVICQVIFLSICLAFKLKLNSPSRQLKPRYTCFDFDLTISASGFSRGKDMKKVLNRLRKAFSDYPGFGRILECSGS